jgi:hypothetical protein
MAKRIRRMVSSFAASDQSGATMISLGQRHQSQLSPIRIDEKRQPCTELF